MITDATWEWCLTARESFMTSGSNVRWHADDERDDYRGRRTEGTGWYEQQRSVWARPRAREATPDVHAGANQLKRGFATSEEAQVSQRLLKREFSLLVEYNPWIPGNGKADERYTLHQEWRNGQKKGCDRETERGMWKKEEGVETLNARGIGRTSKWNPKLRGQSDESWEIEITVIVENEHKFNGS